MSKISRATQTIFGGTGSTSNFGQFGSLAASSPTTSKTPSVIQGLSAWLAGWQAATVGVFVPPYQDMNSVHYLAFYQICYILQQGIAEWDSGTTYYTNSVCQFNGVWYNSRVDTNINNEPDTSPTQWAVVSYNVYGGTVASTSSMTLPNTGNSFKVTGTTTINNITLQPAGTIVNLIFTGSLLVNTGGNLLLNSGVFNTVSNNTLSLISDGTNWFEISRSPSYIGIGNVYNVSPSTPIQAPTDGTISIRAICGGGFAVIQINSDSSSTPSTEVGFCSSSSSTTQFSTQVLARIKKGNYYQVLTSGSGSFSNAQFTPEGQ